ncbi:DciA family protein [Volucribacter amazonae]|uniref:DUF721 domain-containing protein n=1 Tax=Volucribacter amazonae TaxID=256731 RepID=A0A9X4P818_9PAST|nr:DciA family protein [Volucribacter amazonae]MDG6894350.1 hypothetical protein [Volucribacter amazonae]
MRNKKMMNIKGVLANSSLSQIMQRGLFLSQLNQQLQSLLPVQFRYQFRIANIQSNQLCLEAKNASVRQALLFKQPALLALIQQQSPHINQLVIRINPEL